MFRLQLRLLIAWMVVLFAGCSGNAGLTLANLPEFKDAGKVDKGANSIVDAAIKTLQNSAQQEGLTAEAQVYTVPAEKTWEDISGFYVEELKGEWAENESLMAEDKSGVQQMSWTRKGLLTRDQILVLAWVVDKDTNKKFYMLMLYSK